MSNTAGIVNGKAPIGTDGISDASGDIKSTDRTSQRSDESEVIYGSDGSEDGPSTERFIDPTTGNNSDGIRYTKSGKPDGRSTRRGRPAGTGSGKRIDSAEAPDKVRLDSFNIGDLLFGIHMMLASALKTPELQLDKDEAERLGKASADLAAQYNHVISSKTAAWIQIGIVAGQIYVPRVVAIRMRERAEKDARKIKLAPPPTPIIPPEPLQRSDLN